MTGDSGRALSRVTDIRHCAHFRTAGFVLTLASVAVVTGSVLAWGASDMGAGGSKRCRPKGSHTLIENRYARVFTERDRSSALRGYEIFGCAFSRGKEIALDVPDATFAFLPPAISLTHEIVGFAVESCDEGTETCTTDVAGIRLTDTDISTQHVQGYSADPTSQQVVKVGSLRMKRNGSVAWITCPERSVQPDEVIGARHPNCVRPGDRDRVYKLEGRAGKATLLDHGRAIDPSSLRRGGSRLSWLHGRHRRHAVLR